MTEPYRHTGSPRRWNVVDEERRAMRRLAAEHAVSDVISDGAGEPAIENALAAVCVTLDLQWAGYWSVDGARGVLRCDAIFQDPSVTSNRFTEASRSRTFGPGDGLPGKIWSSAESQWFERLGDAHDAPRFDAAGHAGFVAGFGCPVSVAGKLVAVIEFYADRTLRRDAELIASVASLASQIGQYAARVRAEQELRQREAAFRAALADRTAERDAALAELEERTGEAASARIEVAAARREADAARGEAERANRARSDFLAVISHELRTPLNAIIGYTDLLLSGIPGPLPDASRAHVDRVHGAAQHLLQLIEEVLSFSRIDTGNESVQPRPVDVVEIATDVARAMEPAAKRKELELKLTVPDELRVESDASKVRQILSNLVSNAIKFTERGGVEIGAEHLDGGALLRVRDTGIGMEPENLARIFEPFWQAETATTRKQGGTGLGLSVSRKLARMLGGEIEVTSELGRGTEFTVRLPAAPPRASEPGAGPQ